jgi:hypothetical protein
LPLAHSLVQFIEIILLDSISLLDVLFVYQATSATGEHGKNSAK